MVASRAVEFLVPACHNFLSWGRLFARTCNRAHCDCHCFIWIKLNLKYLVHKIYIHIWFVFTSHWICV